MSVDFCGGNLHSKSPTMASARPLLSIITVVRNAVRDIEDTLRSVAALKNDAIEYIVIDGGSTDGTQALIAAYADDIDYTHSRTDGGIYPAMNEGLEHAHGHFVLNMNAGDRLLSVPTELLEAHTQDGTDLICCRVETDGGFTHLPLWDGRIKKFNTLPHQGCFYRRALFAQYRYDIRYRIFADFDLNQRLFATGAKGVLGRESVAFHSLGGVSNSGLYAEEMFTIVRRNFGIGAQVCSWLYFKKQGLKERLRKWFGLQLEDPTKKFYAHESV